MPDELERLADMRELIKELDRGIASATKAKECGGRGTYGLGVETLKTLRALAARCDQPAGEPVPLPEPVVEIYERDDVGSIVEWKEGSESIEGPRHLLYTADQLRTHREEYAETVAAPLRERVAELEAGISRAKRDSRVRTMRIMQHRIKTAERERDEAKARSRYWKQRAKSAEGHLMASDLDAAARAVHSTSTLAGTDWDDLTAIQRATMTRAAALAISTINACRDARKPAGIDSAMVDDDQDGPR